MGTTIRSDQQLQELTALLEQKRDRAIMLGAAEDMSHEDNPGLGFYFVLSDENGAVRAHVTRGGVYLSCNSVHYGCDVVDIIIDGDGSMNVRSDEGHGPVGVGDELAPTLIGLIGPMAVAPLVQVPYGFVLDGEVVGITFMTDIEREVSNPTGGRIGRKDLGLVMDTYFVRDPRGMFAFVGEKNPVDWFTGFWGAYQQGAVINLSGRIRALEPGLWGCSDGISEVWLEFDRVDDLSPAFRCGERYRSWEPRTNDFSREPRGSEAERNPLLGFFS